MTRVVRLLLVLIVVELGIGAWLAASRLNRSVAPQADWSLLDPATAEQLRSAAAECQTADEWRTLAELYMASGCLPEAEACHRIACQLDPDNAVFIRQWAFALERLGLLEDANAQYQRAIDLKIRKADGCRYLIARNHLRREKAAEARRVFEEGKSLAANQYELARLDLREGDLASAERRLRQLAESHATTLQVNLLGYRLALKKGDERQAAAFADRARYAPQKLLNPFDDEAARIVGATASLGSGRHWQSARELMQAGKFDDAQRMLSGAAQVDRSPQVLELLAEVALQQHRFDDAIGLYEEFQERNGPTPRIMARLGDVWDAAGQGAKAREAWSRAAHLESSVDLKAVHHKLAKSYAAAGDQEAADRHLARGHYYVGRELMKIDHPDKSINYFAAAVKHAPEFELGWFYLGESRRLSGQRTEAIAAYESCLTLNPNHGRALAALELLGANHNE